MIITASGGPCKQLVGYIPVPMEWPEQRVKVLEEDISPGVTIDYQPVSGTARVMTFKIASIDGGKEAKAVVTFAVRRQVAEKPEKTDGYKFIEAGKIGRDMRPYVVPSPKIESRDGKIRALAKEVGAEKKKAWDRVEAIYQWVRENIKIQEGPLKGAAAALRSGSGDSEDATRRLSPSAARPAFPPAWSGSRGAAMPSSICWTRRTRGTGFRVRRRAFERLAAFRRRGRFCRRATAWFRRLRTRASLAIGSVI